MNDPVTGRGGFVHLHTHSECSELDSVARVKDLVAAAAADGQPALAISDHGSLSALWALHTEAAKAGIKPIAGLEAYVAIGSRHEHNTVMVPADDADPDAEDSEDGLKRKTYEHLTILARNATGWQNLVRMHLEANKSRWGKHPRIDYDLLAQHADGLIVLTGCLAGPVMGPLARVQRLAVMPALWQTRRAVKQLPKTEQGNVLEPLRKLKAVFEEADWHEAEQREAVKDAMRAVTTAARDVNDPDDTLGDSMGALATAVKSALKHHQPDNEAYAQARAGLQTLVDAVGAENVYVEVMEHGIDVESNALPALADLAKEFGLPLVATNDAHHTHADDAHAHEAWLALQTRARLTDPAGRGKGKRFAFNGTGYHLRTEEQMRSLRPESWWQEACDNTVTLAERVEADVFPERKLRLPRFPVPDGFASSKAYLKHLVTEGAKARYGDPYPAEVADRLTYEFKVLTHFQIWDYFLILHELVTWCRAQGILVGPGRGSAAGSACAYVLGLTNVDPIRYGLLFERFLDPTRVGMPDIDTDFEQGSLDRIREHLVDVYGHEHVVRIGTFGFARSKAAVKDAARVLGVDPQTSNRVSKAIPVTGGKPATFDVLDARTEETTGFWDLVDEVPGGDSVVDLARSFEGVIKARGIHACGTVIADEDLTSMVPLRTDTKSALGERAPLVTEWDADGISEDGMGLLKLDILGLRNLDIVSAALRNIELLTGERVDPVTGIPDPDDLSNPQVEAAWEMIGAGRTSAVFQLESEGMTRLAQDVVPGSMEHMSALVALYRPGPLSADMHLHYAARKNGREPVNYSIFTHDRDEQEVLQRVLGPTYALTVYQETMMQLGDEVAGFTVVERNRLRKAISKKKEAEITELGKLFLVGAQSRYRMASVSDDTTLPVQDRVEWDTDAPKVPFSAESAKKVWATIEGAGSYAFNKCLTGQALVQNGSREQVTIESVYRRLHGQIPAQDGVCHYCHERPIPATSKTFRCTACKSWRDKFTDKRGFYLLAVDSTDHRIRPQKLKDVHFNGFREVFEVTLADGRSVKATGNHRFMRADGSYVRVDQIEPGITDLSTDGGYQEQFWEGRYRVSKGERTWQGRVFAPGDDNIGYIDGGSVALKEWTAQTRPTAACDECGLTEADTRLERAHLDGDHSNQDPANLAWKCVSHHKMWDYRRNGRRKRWGKGALVGSSTVVSVEPAGVEAVYDVEMESGTDHNFLANGIVSHNSHSMAYGYIGFVTAYLKANWPAAFTAAVLEMTDDKDRRALTIRSASDEGLVITTPDLNVSGLVSTAVDEATVALGLAEIKDVGDAAVGIVAERDANGPFSGVADLMRRVPTVSTVVARALIEAGACDAFGPRLGQMRALYGLRRTEVPVLDEEWGVLARSARQHNRLGLSVGQHPMAALTDQLKVWRPDVRDEDGNQLGTKVTRLHRVSDDARENFLFATVGMVTRWDVKPARRGMRAEVELEGSRGSLSAVIWDDALRALKADGVEVGMGTVLGVLGRARTREFEHTKTVIDPDTAEEVEETVITRRQSVSLVKAWVVQVDDVGARSASVSEHSGQGQVVDLAEYLHGGSKARVGLAAAPQAAHAAGARTQAPRSSTTGLRAVADSDAAPAPAVAPVRPLRKRPSLGTVSKVGAGTVPVVVTRPNWTVGDVESMELRKRFFQSGALPRVLREGVAGDEPVVLRVRGDVPGRRSREVASEAAYALVVCLPAGSPAEHERMRDDAVAAAVDAIWEPFEDHDRWERMVASVSAPAHTRAEAA